MSELDQLRSLGDQVVPPSFELLRETARRRLRAVTLSRVQWPPRWPSLVVVSTALLAGTEDRSAPEPVGPPHEVSTTPPAHLRPRGDDPLRRADGRRARTRSSSWT